MQNKKTQWDNNHIILYLTVLGTIAAIYVAFFFPINSLKIKISDIIFTIVNILVVIALFFAASRASKFSKKLSHAWRTIAIAHILYTIGDIIWGVYEIFLHIDPFPSIADVFYLLYYPVLLYGIFLFPRETISRVKQIGKWFDAIIVFISAGLGFWVYIISPLALSAKGESIITQLLSIAYPVGDLVILFAVIVLLCNYPRNKTHTAFLFLILSFLFQVATDIIFSLQSLTSSYESAGWLDIGWILGCLLLGIASFIQSTYENKSHRKSIYNRIQGFPISIYIEKIGLILPYLLVVFSFGFLIYFHSKDFAGNNFYLDLGIGLLIVLVMIRQYLVIIENNDLTRNLEEALSKLNDQSDYLQITNNNLRDEILERKRIAKQLSFDALHDSLTLLPNRTLLIDRINHAIEITKRDPDHTFSLLYMDLDQFKIINDRLGHSAGDEFLVIFKNRVLECLRKSDTFARMGGDEFAIFLEYHSKDGSANTIANRILNISNKPYSISGLDFFITVSIGIVNINSRKFNSAEEILRDADIAMYHAKDLGKARAEVFSVKLRKKAISKINLVSQMRSSLVNHDFVLHYQPIYELMDKKLVGFEALLRWNHPSRGLLFPIDFLSAAENSGFIFEIGEWVFIESCRQMREWIDQNSQFNDLSINVNLSGKQFTYPYLVNLLKTVLKKTGLKPKNLHLEITETSLIENKEIATELFYELRKLGIGLHIDDFGAGYSSIGYLKRFPVDTIKIDKSFIHDIENNGKDTQIVKTIIDMAENLGMNIIAEGIENNEQLVILKSLACSQGQGFYLSHPLPALEVENNFMQYTLPPDVIS